MKGSSFLLGKALKNAKLLPWEAIIYLLLCCVLSPCKAEPQYGLSLWGQLKYPADFPHYDFVNPDAPREGEVQLAAHGSFDSLNYFLVRGTAAPGVLLTHAYLLDPARDELMASYGYVAQQVNLSPDRFAVTFTLNAQAQFSNGEPLTAEDVRFSFNILKEKGIPMYRTYFADVTKIDILTPRQIRFTFKTNKNRELPLIIGQIPIFSRTYYEKHKFDGVNLEIPPGSGPYKITAIDPGRSITYERVGDWWAAKLPSQRGRYNFRKITYVMYRDDNAMFMAFKAGQSEIFFDTKAARWQNGYDFPAVRHGWVQKVAFPIKHCGYTRGFFFNTRRPVFADIRVREALTLVLDFTWLNTHLFYEMYTRNLSYFPSSDFAQQRLPQGEELLLLQKYQLPSRILKQPFTLPEIKNDQQRRVQLAKATKLLTEAGWVLKDGNLTKHNQPFSFEILLTDQALQRVLTPYVHSLKRLGIEATIRTIDAVNYQTRMRALDFDMIYGIIPQSDNLGNEQRDYWGSAQANQPATRNFAGINDKVIDDLVELLIVADTRERQLTIAHALDRVLLWGFYMIPAWQGKSINVAYWNRFGRPAVQPAYNPVATDTWWVDPHKDEALQRSR